MKLSELFIMYAKESGIGKYPGPQLGAGICPGGLRRASSLFSALLLFVSAWFWFLPDLTGAIWL